MPHPRSSTTTTVAILGANAVVENAIAQLLEGDGYSTRVLKPFPMGGAQGEEMPDIGGADLMILAPSLSPSECDAFLAARRRTTQERGTRLSPIPVIVLTSPMRETPRLLGEEEAVRSVLWPTSREGLVREIEDVLLEARFPAHTEKRNRRRSREGGIHS
jgi:CheY-like chemotaxis protein